MKIIEYSVKNPVFANLLMATIIIFGLYIGFGLPKELFPSIGFEKVTVSTVYENSSAEDIEKLITIPIEDKISSISGIKNIKSESSESRSFVIAELLAGEDTNRIAQEIRSEISQIKNELPDDIDDPIVKEVKGSAPLINVSIASDGNKNELRFYARDLKNKLEKLNSVESLIVSGYGDLVFWIKIDPKKLIQYEIRLDTIVNQIKNKNVDLPAGAVNLGDQEFTVRTEGKIQDKKDIEQIPLKNLSNGTTLRLKDIANIYLGQQDDLSLSRINSMDSVSFWIEKQKGKDAIEAVEEIKKITKKFIESSPENIKVFISNDSSYWVKGRFDSMIKTGIYGIIAVLIVLALFLDFRSAFLAALGLPVAFFGAFILMQYTGNTLNVITMFGLIMVLGIVVDDAIIVVENIKRYIQKGIEPAKAAIMGAQEVAWPVIATVLTNIASLFPILLAEGTLGIFLSIIPTVAIFALIFSLVEALTILPSHCAEFVRTSEKVGIFSKYFDKFRRKYLYVLISALRVKYKIIGIFVVVFFVCVGALYKIPFVLLYSSDINQYLVKIQNPTSYSLESTLMKSKEIEKIIDDNTNINLKNNSLTTVGVDFSKKPPGFGDHVSNILVQFKDFEQRKENGLQSMKKVQKYVDENVIGPSAIEFVETTGPPKGKDVDIRIIGDDTKILSEISFKFKNFLKSQNGVFGVNDNLSYGKPQANLRINEEKAQQYGLNTITVGREIRALIDGLEIDETRINDEKAIIKVKYELEENNNSVMSLSNHLVLNKNQEFVPIGNFTDIVLNSDLLTISRFNRQRAASVTAEVDGDITTPRDVINSSLKFYDDIKDDYPGYKIALDGEEQDTRESLNSVKRASVIAILLIYLILATILRSYIQPLLIMSIVPFCLIGVTFGILLRGDPISITGLIGMVALIGVVINDSLLLMNFINKGVKNNLYGFAVFISAKNRFRAVILTTLTTFGGLLTLMFETRGEAAYLAPMAISLGVGLVIATFITLFLIPCLYLTLIDFKRRFNLLN
mgnify:CR=1 FL=1|tara:strand:+ start:26839 stop:29898 length:3060 start_codon:yes stop_codon:yes gene_type:complete